MLAHAKNNNNEIGISVLKNFILLAVPHCFLYPVGSSCFTDGGEFVGWVERSETQQ